MKMGCSRSSFNGGNLSECNSSGRLLIYYVSGAKHCISDREIRERECVSLARREGYTFFDEDDVCAGFLILGSLSELSPGNIFFCLRLVQIESWHGICF